MTAGRPLGQLSACFSSFCTGYDGDIFEAIKQAGLIHKSVAGRNFHFPPSPEGDTVKSTAVRLGPISFMKGLTTATEAVKQGGTRRVANMGILLIATPTSLNLSTARRRKEITNFNISWQSPRVLWRPSKKTRIQLTIKAGKS
jgi:ribonucleoside-diphosphate reductase alpha chain